MIFYVENLNFIIMTGARCRGAKEGGLETCIHVKAYTVIYWVSLNIL